MLWIGIAGILIIAASAILGLRMRTSGAIAKIGVFILGTVGLLLLLAAVWSTDDFRSDDNNRRSSLTPTPTTTHGP